MGRDRFERREVWRFIFGISFVRSFTSFFAEEEEEEG